GLSVSPKYGAYMDAAWREGGRSALDGGARDRTISWPRLAASASFRLVFDAAKLTPLALVHELRPSVLGWSLMIAAIALVTMPIVTRERRRVRNDLVRGVVTVLLRVEDTSLTLERARLLRAEDASRRRIAVRNVDSGDLVIAVVLEA